jgi:CRISPR/Cas system-associated exonuclease Cas4 (RecB family)
VRASFSRVNSFSFCAKKYEFRYVLEAPAPRKPELAFGTALHAALEYNFTRKLETRRDLTSEEIAPVFREALQAELSGADEESLRGAADPHYMRAMGEHLLDRFLKERAPSLMPAPRGVEGAFRLPLPGGHEISGKFDLLDTDWVLHDFKTSSKPYDARKADPTQLVIYAWACERLFGRFPKAMCYDVFVKGDGADGAVSLQDPVVVPLPTPDVMAQVARRLQRQLDRIAQVEAEGLFPRAFQPPRCGWCEYQKPCVQEWEEAGRPAPARIQLENLV